MEYLLLHQSRSGVRVGVDIFSPESELESLKICRLRSPGHIVRLSSLNLAKGPESSMTQPKHLTPRQTTLLSSRAALHVLSDTDTRFTFKVDLTDGFFQLPVHKSLSPFLGV